MTELLIGFTEPTNPNWKDAGADSWRCYVNNVPIGTYPISQTSVNHSVSGGYGTVYRVRTSLLREGEESMLSPENVFTDNTRPPLDQPGAPTILLLQSKRYNPGHYVALRKDADSVNPIKAAEEISANSGVVGVSIRAYWNDIETSPEVFDFTYLDNTIDVMKVAGLRYIIFPFYRSFLEGVSPIPHDLNQVPQHLFDVQGGSNGMNAVLWNPTVLVRWKNFVSALADRYDSDPMCEGMIQQESSLGISDADQIATGYSPELWRDTLIDTWNYSNTQWKRGRHFGMLNFISGNNSYMKEVADSVNPQCAVGGPDMLPDDVSLNGSRENRVYETVIRTRPANQIRWNSCQNSSYEHIRADKASETYWTPQQLHDWGRDYLGLEYIIWNNRKFTNPIKGGVGPSYTIADAYPVMNANPVINHQYRG